MATLRSRTGSAVTLKVVGYQFPDSTADYDRDWLMIALDVDAPDRRWHTTDPALLTWELRRLAEWFAALSHGELESTAEFAAIEPNLSLVLRRPPPSILLEAVFALEFHPDRDPGAEPFRVPLEITEADAAQFSAELRRELAAFPQR